MEIFTDKDTGCMAQDSLVYPKLLRLIDNPPVKLNYYGDPNVLNSRFPLSIIGSRNMSVYGLQVIESVVKDLQGLNVVTISGFTRGVDVSVHSLSVKYKIPTVAVLPFGLGHLMKISDGELVKEIVQNSGLILSEYDFEIEPKKWTFIERNRIVAGISVCSVVIEAAEGSGSLLTAALAHKFKREVYAVPGSIFSPLSRGIYLILKDYAKLLVSGSELVERLGFSVPPKNEFSGRSEELSSIGVSILRHLYSQPLDIDSLGAVLGLSLDTLSIELFNLRRLGFVFFSEGKYYAKNN